MPRDYRSLSQRILVARGSMSQAELAKRSGVSNKTISEYERGNFSPTRKPSIDVLARLALTLGKDPAEWIRLAGLEYNSARVEQARRQLALRSSEEDFARVVGHSSLNSLEELRTARRPVVRVSVAETSTYSTFDREHVTLLCKLINYRWGCEFHVTSTYEERTAQLYKEENRCHIMVGGLETLERIAGGLRFIPYPGFEYRINGVWNADFPVPISWDDLRGRKKDILAVTITGEAGDQYLRAICGYDESANNIISIEEQEASDLSSFFSEALSTYPNRPVVLCAVEDSCYRVLQRKGKVNLQLLSKPDKASSPIYLPTYRPGIAVRHEDSEWAAVLEKAQEMAIRNAPDRLARLYANLLVQLIPLDEPVGHSYSFGRLYDLHIYSCTDFLNCLRKELRLALQSRAFPQADHENIIDYSLEQAFETRSASPEFQELLERTRRIEEALGRLKQSARSK